MSKKPEMPEKESEKRIGTYIVLAVIIVLQLVYATYIMVYRKDGTHSDEIWSYGLANSYYKPFLYLDDGVFIDTDIEERLAATDNYREWVSGKELHDYITVQPGERFAYGSVYHNQSLDHHPPLYYFVLHTVCSFFPDTFSYYQSYFINVVCMIFTQIFLFRLACLLCKNKNAALVVCLLYGGGTGAMATTIFLRQYCMITTLTTMYLYYNARIYQGYHEGEENVLKKHLLPMFITAFALFFTNYTVALFCGVYTASMCVYLICRKKIKDMFIYGGATAGALALSFVLYPYALKQSGQLTDTGTDMMKVYWMEFRLMLSYTLRYVIGTPVSIYQSSVDDVLLGVLGVLILLMLPLAFLFRKETWFRKFIKDVVGQIKNFGKWFGKANYVPLFIFLSGAAMVFFLAYVVDVVRMGDYAVRYVFMLFPALAVIVVCAAQRILTVIPKVKKYSTAVMCVIVAALLVYIDLTQVPTEMFFEEKGEGTAIEELVKDKNVVVIFKSQSDNDDDDTIMCSWMNTCYAAYLRDCSNVYFTSTYSVKNDMSGIREQNDIAYVLAPLYSFTGSGPEKELYQKYYKDPLGDNVKIKGENDHVEGQASMNEVLNELGGRNNWKPLYIKDVQGGDFLVVELHPNK